MTEIPRVPIRHRWSHEDIRIVYTVCRETRDLAECKRILHEYFPDCTNGSIAFAILRYKKRNENKMRWNPPLGIYEGYGANGRLFDEVWNEQDWRRYDNN